MALVSTTKLNVSIITGSSQDYLYGKNGERITIKQGSKNATLIWKSRILVFQAKSVAMDCRFNLKQFNIYTTVGCHVSRIIHASCLQFLYHTQTEWRSAILGSVHIIEL